MITERSIEVKNKCIKKSNIVVGLVSSAIILLCSLFFTLSAKVESGSVVFLRDGGSGDGSSYAEAIGDFKQAVRLLAKTGGTVVLCGKYTYTELINLSDRSLTANGDKTIKVTSIHGGTDYRLTSGAMLCAGNDDGSANMILAGNFIFENLDIVTSGGKNSRAIICGGNKTIFGSGIKCKKNGDAPYISIVGITLDSYKKSDGIIEISSGTYNYVCSGNRNGNTAGNTSLVINGGIFEGDVSASGIIDEGFVQNGSAVFVIKGGTFNGRVGALTKVSGDFKFEINSGTFRKKLECLGRLNYVDINGGNLENISEIRVSDAPDPIIIPQDTVSTGNDTDKPMLSESTSIGETIKDEAPDVTLADKTELTTKEEKEPIVIIESSIININNYAGNINAMVGKIKGKGVKVNIKSSLESDTMIETEILKPVTQTGVQSGNESNAITETGNKNSNDSNNSEKSYILGSLKNTVTVVVLLGILATLSAVVFAYRATHEKKDAE